MSSELEALLESERQSGSYDSTGTFTLSLLEARRKLAQYQLASLEMAVLKLIQGVIQLEPVAMWIDCDDSRFTLNWADAQESLPPAQFVGDLERVILGEARPVKNLAIGILGSLEREPLQAWLPCSFPRPCRPWWPEPWWAFTANTSSKATRVECKPCARPLSQRKKPLERKSKRLLSQLVVKESEVRSSIVPGGPRFFPHPDNNSKL